MLISEEQKLDAWRWLAGEAIAGNLNAVAVLIDWSTPPEADVDVLDEIAVTFQWWLDEYDRKPARSHPGMGVVPVRPPSLKTVCMWIREIKQAADSYPGTEYGENLATISRCLTTLTHHEGAAYNSLDDAITPPVWPTRPVLESWIKALKAEPPRVA